MQTSSIMIFHPHLGADIRNSRNAPSPSGDSHRSSILVWSASPNLTRGSPNSGSENAYQVPLIPQRESQVMEVEGWFHRQRRTREVKP
jgi:hypothetical protein